MENKEDFDIKNTLIKVNQEASGDAPDSNWVGVLGRSETISISERKSFTTIKHHKLISAAASILVVALISAGLVLSLSPNESNNIKTAKPDKKKISTTTTLKESSTSQVASTTASTTAPNQTTSTQSPATTAAPAPSRPANPSNLQFNGYDLVGSPGDPATYNVYFSWTASPTPGVKYCVGTTSVGSSQIFPNCTWSYQYLETGTSTGFGLVFAQNTTYRFQVTAIDSHNQISDTVYLNWQLP